MALGASQRVDDVLKRFGERPEYLLQMLIALQETENWLPPAALTALASALRLPRARVEGVVGFYSFLHAQPVGRYRLLFSDNIIDRMLGSEVLMARLCHNLWLAPGQVSEDGLASVDVTSCTGLGDQGPAMLVNGRAVAALNEDRIDIICELIRQKLALDAWPAELFEFENNIHQRDALLSCAAPPGDALQAAIAMGRDAWLNQVQASRLRGRGGAGFTTAVKWLACRDAPATEKIVVCNADEGEPGTFKDRVLLSAHADLVFEGMTLAAWAVGARRGFLYLRGEYLNLRPALEATLARRRADGWLGASIGGAVGFDFDIEIHLGAGAYVCGEETALLESLEGKRGTPRIRPPFPVTHGYLGLPTVVNNVETLAKCCLIALHGGAAFAATGTAQSAGTKLLSVSGDCARPGIYEFPFGVTVRQVLDACGAIDTLAVQVGGAAGITLAPYEFGRRVAFEDVPTAGAFMVFNDTRDMFDVAHNFVQFFAHESCGFCTPCRVGTSLLAGTLDKLAEGKGSPADLLEIEDLDRLLKQASHCGLGSAAPNPVIDGLQKFRPAYERHLMHADFSPAFDLDGALRRARQITGRDDAGAHLPQQPEASR
ncbi:NAD(P)H-dependent oxidoreductase subunit E [Zoogloeaceae bacterium G21618-S1]|nr:NAD(P)H-dependent oxidoreductase subunit E [Zoogloeaceae bacterium G21618-S1]